MHGLAAVAGKWLAGARHRGVGYRVQPCEAGESCEAVDESQYAEEYSDVE